jgi:hypothetical protein
MNEERNEYPTLRDWWTGVKKKHPTAIKVGTAIGLGVIGAVIYNRGKKAGHEVYVDRPYTPAELADQMNKKATLEHKDEYRNNRADIDEDVFCNLADFIEDSLFNDGINNAIREETYNVKFPVNGDYKEFKDGLYDVDKTVRISIFNTANGSCLDSNEDEDEDDDE